MKISQADIVIGIPTYNEADSIGLVVKEIDAGLAPYRRRFSCLIINADNNSPDNTKEVFLKTKTKTPKLYIASGTKLMGKGINVLNIFKKSKALRSEAILIFDGDLESITPDWISRYVDSILDGYDFITPIYTRNEYDGSITNHIVYPLIAAIFSKGIRQPIGGDFALSKKFVNKLLTKDWDRNIQRYGVDIFMTISALTGNYNLAQAYLGSKDHKPSLPKLGPMYTQVTTTLFKMLKKSKNSWKNEKLAQLQTLYGERVPSAQNLAVNYKYLKTRALYEFSLHYKTIKKIVSPPIYKKLEGMYFKNKKIRISSSLWVDIMASIFRAYVKNSSASIIDAGRSLYFGRQTSFIKETMELGYDKSEERIIKQAEFFHKNRHKFLK